MSLRNASLLEFCNIKSFPFFIKRDDLLHPIISGNKWRKLKYVLQEVERQGCKQIISFGGAYSNHLHALAYVCKQRGLKLIAVVRGDELAQQTDRHSPMLQDILAWGAQCIFITREQYRQKTKPAFLSSLQATYGQSFIVPEGGCHPLALKGCEEMMLELAEQASLPIEHIFLPVGTGTTLAGMAMCQHPAFANTHLHGIAVLNAGQSLDENVQQLLKQAGQTRSKFKPIEWSINTDYHFGAYGKSSSELQQFIAEQQQVLGITFEPIYTGKALFAMADMLAKGEIHQGENVVLIHTGGLQGKR